MNFKLTEKEVTRILARYPNKEAALLPILRIIQREAGHISPEAEKDVADLLGVRPARVHEVVTFYSRFREKPAGRYLILVCESVCCSLLGAGEILEHLKRRLMIDVGETTPDRLFTLETVECLAQCEQAPAVMINDEVIAPATVDTLDRILEEKSR